ncbi:MAG: hypothetical protein DRH57_06185 [Candidatus Cloacimonadota bacterium]|nr:MAG: hypothetical protein DRH57_06185 [Candidatus Cloacimonadota bacterium]
MKYSKSLIKSKTIKGITNHSTSKLGGQFCLILPNQTAGFSEFEIAGGSWQWRNISGIFFEER